MKKTIIAEQDFEAIWGTCTACGGEVASYLCNDALIAVRPDGADWDWWMSCTNPECEHHYGEGYDQFEPEWVIR